MNKRFEKLVAEAFFDETADASDTKIYKLNDAQMQQFAELIVAECEQAIRAEVAATDISGEVEKAWGMGMECGVYTIKKHFGVEP